MKRHGFTIVETIISLAITVAVLGFAIYFMRDAKKQAAMASMKGTLRAEAQNALRSLERDIASTRAKYSGLDDDDTERYEAEIELTNNSLKAKVSKDLKDSSGLMFEDINDDESNYYEVSYYIDSDKHTLMRKGENGKTSLVARHIESFGPFGDANNDSRLSGNIGVIVKFKANIPGTKMIATHTESLIAAVRQLQTKKLESGNDTNDSRSNSRWRQKHSASSD